VRWMRRAFLARAHQNPMKRQPLISRAPRTLGASAPPSAPGEDAVGSATAAKAAIPAAQYRPKWTEKYRNEILFLLGCALIAWVFYVLKTGAPAAQRLTQKQLDAAIMHTLENNALPSQAARAAEIIAPSVVRVRGFGTEEDAAKASKADAKEPNQIDPGDADENGGTGTGVIIKDDGTILTNLHVVSGAKKIRVRYFNGMETDAEVIGGQPENDLAVLKPKALPDDLQPATMRSTSDLRPGDMVVAVGFPFGIGPSTSAGVVSGLKREFRSPLGKRVLTNLIQFDAAANPGNSGGPLVTADGEVVGIVTGILNPTDQRVFIGIGFAVPIENAASAVGMSPF
jgi:serine protease DegQ